MRVKFYIFLLGTRRQITTAIKDYKIKYFF